MGCDNCCICKFQQLQVEVFPPTEMEGEMKKKLLEKARGELVEVGINEREERQELLKERIMDETKKLWVVAGPAIFARFATFGVNVISQAFVGHIGSTELAAFALVATVLLRFANSIQVIFSLCLLL